MADQEPTSPSPNTQVPKQVAPLDVMQAIREGMASLISLVILVLAAITMWYTFVSGGAAASPAQVEAYNRQKDVMLYALALFGTVTGYYLGRIPAEVNAKRADAAANAAQTQLVRTQDKLTDTAANASVAAAQLGQVKEEKTKIAKNLKETTGALRQAQDALTGALPSPGGGRRTFGAEATPADEAEDRLREARDHIARVLARVEDED
jgi:hypothetical protein